MFTTLAPPTGRPPLLHPVNNHPADDQSTEAHPAPPEGAEPKRKKVEPLGAGWIAVTVVIGLMAALIALGGMTLSFRAVRAEMVPAFGARWAWLVPVVVDVAVFVFSGVDLVLARLDMSHPLARWTVYGATFGTVWLNYSAGGGAAGRVAHVLMPSLWVVFVELMRHVVRRQVNLSTDSHREPIPAARWLVSPWPTLVLWRRMVLWRQHSYTAALQIERTRLGAIATARELHGPRWRSKVGPLMRLQISLGEIGADVVHAAAPIPAPDPIRPADPIRSGAATRSDPTIGPARIRSDRATRRTGSGQATRSVKSTRRAAPPADGGGGGEVPGDLLDKARAVVGDGKPTAEAIREALHIAPKTARLLRELLIAERHNPAA